MRRWRGAVPGAEEEMPDGLRDVAAGLTAAAAEAPPSTRALEIRAAVLEEAATAGGAGTPLRIGTLLFAGGLLLLVVAIGVGVPAVTSFIGSLLESPDRHPSVASPSPTLFEGRDRDAVPMPTDAAIPSREITTPGPAIPSQAAATPTPASGEATPVPAPRPADATPKPTPVPEPQPSVAPTPPSGPPVPVPTPPVSPQPPRDPGG